MQRQFKQTGLLQLNAHRRVVLREAQCVGARRGIVCAIDAHGGRARLLIPATELAQIHPIRIGHRRSKIIARDCCAIMAFKIQIHAFAKAFATQQRLVHAHHFCAFFVHGHGVKIIDFFVSHRANRVRHRACIFCELRGAQIAHIIDALDCTRAGCGGFGQAFGQLIAGKLLIAVNGQTFF